MIANSSSDVSMADQKFLNVAKSNEIDPDAVPISRLDSEGHSIFAEWRPKRPFLRREDGVFLVLRADHIFLLGTDPRTRQIETELMLNRGVKAGAVFDFIGHSMLFSNGETHGKRRSGLSKAFSFRMVEALRPEIAKITERLWDELQKVDDFNFTEMYASQLPALTIASVLGLPSEDTPFFTRLVYKVSRCLSPSWRDEEFEEIEASAIELQDYVRGVIADSGRRMRDDFLSRYLRAVREAGTLSPIEEIMQLMLIILAGSDTTRTAMVMVTALVLQNPALWSSLTGNQSYVAAAVEEGLRFEPPVGSFPRLALEDIDLDGYVLPKGSLLALSVMSGLRDEKHYEHPQLFDVGRQQMRWHLGFGAGVHRCLGETLARIELQEGLGTLLRRAPNLAVVGDWPRMMGHGGIRRVTDMTVKLSVDR
ncbi:MULTISPECIES: cytochrome P450 [Agrobacterium]|uniref:Cytochrome P450 n=2 Tax=Agrobacterium tumefaciens complex TaxID=1183400 RepID=A0AAE6EID1_AGRTU|nr:MULTISPECIES: cytochrome P450 [Agrobacterium]ASK40706.1 cytochrome [Agrobacterium genomosp. 6]ASK40873.1 cytochrome [Agrobacterium genomosp. 6]ASK41469.1 cytochrome [Agrobacterium genomosp. 6]QCL77495.1 cytochrome P450 [Agrobacterium tumefaciens]QCL82983.1 cytochrome P450 [Agrobacterium tumefaciens]